MFLTFNDRLSDSPFVERVWRSRSDSAGVFLVIGAGGPVADGYLGGAIATHLRISNPLFTHTLFPIYVALMIWGGLYLREKRLRALVPLRH